MVDSATSTIDSMLTDTQAFLAEILAITGYEEAEAASMAETMLLRIVHLALVSLVAVQPAEKRQQAVAALEAFKQDATQTDSWAQLFTADEIESALQSATTAVMSFYFQQVGGSLTLEQQKQLEQVLGQVPGEGSA